MKVTVIFVSCLSLASFALAAQQSNQEMLKSKEFVSSIKARQAAVELRRAYDNADPATQAKMRAERDRDKSVTPDYIDQVKKLYAVFESETGVKYVEGINRTGIELLKHVVSQDANVNRLYSPVAIASNNLLYANLLKDSYAAQILQQNNWQNMTLAQVNEVHSKFVGLSDIYRRGYELNLGSKLWVRDAPAIPQSIQQRIDTTFGERLGSMSTNSDSLAQSINGWVDQVTKGNIKDFVKADDLEDTQFFAANVVFMDAKWRVPFTTGREHEFQTPTGSVNVPYMSASDEMPKSYLAVPRVAGGDNKDAKFYVVSLPYSFGTMTEVFGEEAHGQAYMWLLVPNDGVSLSEVVADMTYDNFILWSETFAQKGSTWFDLYMPKWNLMYEDKKLEDHLVQIGVEAKGVIPALFNGQPLPTTVPPRQMAFISVGENGTTAGAVQARGGGVSSSIPPFSLRVDRPFAYLIVDSATNAILFTGVVTNPQLTK